MTDIVFPDYTESEDEKATVIKWNFSEGQEVEEDDELIELLTDKAAFTIPSPAKGVLRRLVSENDQVKTGKVLGRIEEIE